MRGTGRTTKQRDTAFTNILKEQDMKETGNKINKMVKALKHGLMDQNLSVPTKME